MLAGWEEQNTQVATNASWIWLKKAAYRSSMVDGLNHGKSTV